MELGSASLDVTLLVAYCGLTFLPAAEQTSPFRAALTMANKARKDPDAYGEHPPMFVDWLVHMRHEEALVPREERVYLVISTLKKIRFLQARARDSKTNAKTAIKASPSSASRRDKLETTGEDRAKIIEAARELERRRANGGNQDEAAEILGEYARRWKRRSKTVRSLSRFANRIRGRSTSSSSRSSSRSPRRSLSAASSDTSEPRGRSPTHLGYRRRDSLRTDSVARSPTKYGDRPVKTPSHAVKGNILDSTGQAQNPVSVQKSLPSRVDWEQDLRIPTLPTDLYERDQAYWEQNRREIPSLQAAESSFPDTGSRELGECHWAVEVNGRYYELQVHKHLVVRELKDFSYFSAASMTSDGDREIKARIYVGSCHMQPEVIQEIGQPPFLSRFDHV